MIPTVIERLLASVVFIAAFAAVVKSIGFLKRWRVHKHSIGQLLPPGVKIEEPTLLYFWSAGCSQCKPQERQIGQAKAALLGMGKTFAVLKLNALEEHALTASMQVMTVPTTVLVDTRGKVAAWNPGLTLWQTIVEQYEAIE